MRILIIEDDALIALCAEDILTDAGHTVVGLAPTKLRALQLAQQTRPDLALIDIRLADGETGLEVALEFSKHHIATIIVSALPRSMVTAALASSFVEKPFAPEMLLDAIAGLGPTIPHSEAA
jgi:two-component system, response regulator PdtaR